MQQQKTYQRVNLSLMRSNSHRLTHAATIHLVTVADTLVPS